VQVALPFKNLFDQQRFTITATAFKKPEGQVEKPPLGDPKATEFIVKVQAPK
jgi:hypothetical protein